MTHVVSSSAPIAGKHVVKRYAGFGIRGADIPTDGDNPSPVLNDGLNPNGEYYWRVVTPPSDGVLDIYPDMSFLWDATGVPNGYYPWEYWLGETGVWQTPTAIVDQRVGVVTHDAIGSLSASAATVSASADRVSGVVTHSANGDLVAGVATVSGDAARLGGYVTHSASAALVCSPASVSGIAIRNAVHASIADLIAASASVAGVARNGLVTYVRAPSGSGATLISASTSRPAQSATSRPSQINTRRY